MSMENSKKIYRIRPLTEMTDSNVFKIFHLRLVSHKAKAGIGKYLTYIA